MIVGGADIGHHGPLVQRLRLDDQTFLGDRLPRGMNTRRSSKLLHYGHTPKGCHFAAWEQPKIFADEVRAFFKTLRT